MQVYHHIISEREWKRKWVSITSTLSVCVYTWKAKPNWNKQEGTKCNSVLWSYTCCGATWKQIPCTQRNKLCWCCITWQSKLCFVYINQKRCNSQKCWLDYIDFHKENDVESDIETLSFWFSCPIRMYNSCDIHSAENGPSQEFGQQKWDLMLQKGQAAGLDVNTNTISMA